MWSLRSTAAILISAIQLASSLIIARPLNGTGSALFRPLVKYNGFTRCYENKDKYQPVTMTLCIPLLEVMVDRPDFKLPKSYSTTPYQNIDFKDRSCVLSLIPGPGRGIIIISLLDMVESAIKILEECEKVGRGGEEEQEYGWHIGVAKNTLAKLPSPAALQL